MICQISIQYCMGRRCNDQGFTIIEVMIATAFLGVGLLSIGTMQLASVKGNKTAMDISEASYLAESKLEELISIPFSSVDVADTNGDGANGLDAETIMTADCAEANGKYTVFWNVAENFPHNNTKTIKVIVTWRKKEVSKRLSIRVIRASG